MEEEKKHYLILSALILLNSALLLIKFLPTIIEWNIDSERLFMDLLGLIWPVMGVSIAIAFLLGDKWGWGGILFHIFILYCAIYYAVLIVEGMFTFQLELNFILTFITNLSIGVVGWVSFFYYYD